LGKSRCPSVVPPAVSLELTSLRRNPESVTGEALVTSNSTYSFPSSAEVGLGRNSFIITSFCNTCAFMDIVNEKRKQKSKNKIVAIYFIKFFLLISEYVWVCKKFGINF
jgi:hypothetical protein